MKQSNNSRAKSGQKRYKKNKNRLSDKPILSKHERWEIRERAKIVYESLSKTDL